ncbi:hypothetical protein [Ottowia sp.]|uniref:hypothetical protein n=1 Tax=Ottowia sp. TaxID=1898956 RepID=UPI003A8B9370
MHKVYVLSAKGQRERNAPHPVLPKELGALLCLVDGHRTAAELVSTMPGKSAVVAGGLRWLKASGYISVVDGYKSTIREGGLTQPADTHSRSALVYHTTPAPVAAPPSTSGAAAELGAVHSAPVQVSYARSDDDVSRILSDFMVQSIRRHLGEGGYVYRRQIERAISVDDLLPHLNPLIDAIVERTGADAGAEFADTAAFILRPQDRDVTLR